jgi:hypothetical protein
MKSLKITAACVHHVPGRLRVRVEEIRHDRAAAVRLARLVETAPGVKSVKANPLTGSLVIHYDCAQTRQSCLLALLNARTLVDSPGQKRRGHASTQVTTTLVEKAGPWLLGKTVEFALEKSLGLAIGALL